VYVTRIRLSGVKGFVGKRAVDLTLPARGGWTVLAGRNGAGKTTLLQGLGLALVGPSVARSLVADFSEWVSTGAREGEAEVRVVPDRVHDGFAGSGRRPGAPLTLRLVWERPALDSGALTSGWRPALSGAASSRGVERGPWQENPSGWFTAGYGPLRPLVGGTGDAQRLMLAPGPAGRMASLFHEDASLAESVSWLIDLHLRRFEGRPGASETLDVCADLLSDGLLPDGFRVAKVDADGLWIAGEDTAHAYPLRQMSDGYRTVAALVLDLVRQLVSAYGSLRTAGTEDSGIAVTQPGVVLIDEIDAHLHVSWQRAIGGWLTSHFPNIQFIVTSHSPYVCQAADPGGLIRLPGPGEQRAPEVVDDDLYQRVVYGSGDDAALSELFGLETPYSDRAERKRRRLVELERKVYAGTASEAEGAEYEELAALLSSSLETRVNEVAARLGGDPDGER
jgi:hypothetical protein